MAVMSGTKFVNAAGTIRMTRYDIVCIHTIVGYAPAHAAHFSTRADGFITQSRDTRYRAAANLEGNYRVISIENEDRGTAFGNWDTHDGHQVPGFTQAQKEAIAKILVWCYQTHGIPLHLAADSKPSSRGIAYHRQGCDGNFSSYAYGGRVYGGELWSNSYGKVCPGDTRIWQLINEIIPRARVLAGLEDEDMAVEDVERMMWKGGPVAGSVAEDTLIARVRDLENMVWNGGPVTGSVAEGTLIADVRLLKAELSEVKDLLVQLVNAHNQS